MFSTAIELQNTCEHQGCENDAVALLVLMPHPESGHEYGSTTAVCADHVQLAAAASARCFLLAHGLLEPVTDDDRDFVARFTAQTHAHEGPLH